MLTFPVLRFNIEIPPLSSHCSFPMPAPFLGRQFLRIITTIFMIFLFQVLYHLHHPHVLCLDGRIVIIIIIVVIITTRG